MVEIEVDGITSQLDGHHLAIGKEVVEYWDPVNEEWVTQFTGNSMKPLIASLIQNLMMEYHPREPGARSEPIVPVAITPQAAIARLYGVSMPD